MARWCIWDNECLAETLANKPSENEADLIITARCTRRISHISLSSIVLPREVLLSTSDEGKSGKSKWSRGRGRALASRALGCDKPSRRPGERYNSEASPKSTLGSQFLGSEYLYEELFPSLDQSTKNTDPNPSKPTKSARGSKQKKEIPSQQQPVLVVEQTTNINTGSFLEKSKHKTDILDKDPSLGLSTSCNSTNDANISNYDTGIKNTTEFSDSTSEQIDWYSDTVEFGMIQNIKASCLESHNNSESMISEISEEFNQDKQSETFNHLTDKRGFEDYRINQNSTNLIEDNVQEDGWIQSDEKDNEQWQSDDDWIESTENEQLIQQCNTDKANICDQLSRSLNDETIICDKLKQIENSNDQSGEYNNHTDLTINEQNVNTEFTRPVENSSLSMNYSNCEEDREPKKDIESKDTQENIKDSLDMSTTSEEMEPCKVLLENLPLALTDEELQDIVEPYGEMVFSNFEEKDDTSKMCVVRMANSMSGELLVVSLDGLEVHGYRIKATMDVN